MGIFNSGSSRWSDEGYVPELIIVQAAICYQLRKITTKHTSNFMGFGAPTVQGRQGIAVQETYDLTGENFYNPYWDTNSK